VKLELIRIEGEAYVTLETIAGCYDCEIAWVAEVYEYGLIGEGRPVGSSVAVPAFLLDRIARIWRWHRREGLAFESIEALLALED
jgi:hypothetical protein